MVNTEIKILTSLPENRWQEHKELRLHGLQDSPCAFTDTLDEARKFSEDEWKERLQKSLFAFAEIDNRLVGQVAAFRYSKEKCKHIYCIVGVYVMPEFRGRGIGKKLLTNIINQIKTNTEISKIELSATTSQTAAIKLYRSLGFTEIGISHRVLKYDQILYDEVLMEMLI